MEWRSHALIGLAVGLGAAYLLGTRDLLGFALMGSFGAIAALVPDLDHDASKGKQILDIVFISFAFFLVYYSGCDGSLCRPDLEALSGMALIFFAFLGVYFLFFRFFKPAHRGITHTLVASVAFGILTYMFSGEMFAIAGTAGYISHLVADNHIRAI